MSEQSEQDVALVRALLPHWYATRQWAEEMLCRAFTLQSALDILGPEHRGRKLIPGSTWLYSTHGVGVDIAREASNGGIDFDFDKHDPDVWRLAIFAKRQLNAGALPPEYKDLVNDDERFEKAAEIVIASLKRR